MRKLGFIDCMFDCIFLICMIITVWSLIFFVALERYYKYYFCVLVILLGTAIITDTKAALWTDGRYHLQASQQLDENWTVMRDGEFKNFLYHLLLSHEFGKIIHFDYFIYTVSKNITVTFSKFFRHYLFRESKFFKIFKTYKKYVEGKKKLSIDFTLKIIVCCGLIGWNNYFLNYPWIFFGLKYFLVLF